MKETYTEPKEYLAEDIEAAALPEKKKMPFAAKLGIYVAVWLVVIAIACGVMWNVMQQYEAAQPWYAVEEYCKTSTQSAFYTALLEAYPDVENPYESIDEIAGDLSAKYGATITYSKLIREYTYESPVYLLQSGDTKLLKLTLESGEKTGFLGLVGYRVRSAELVDGELLALSSYGLAFPKGAEVYVNGKPLTEETLAVTGAFQTFGSDDFSVCMLENFAQRPTVKVTYNGEELTAVDTQNGDFVFDYPESKLHTLTVQAPVGAVLKLGDTRVSEHFVTGSATAVPDRFGAAAAMQIYTIPTVCGEHTVSASVGGEVLTVGDAGGIFVAMPQKETCSVVLPSGAQLYANGSAVDLSAIPAEETAWLSDYALLKNYPAATVYHFTDLYELPAFTASLDGAALTELCDGENITFVAAASEELKEKYTDQTVKFMNAYLYYTTQGYSNTRENLNAVKAHVAYGSPLYKNLESSYIGYYYIAPQRMTTEYMQVDNFVPFGSDAFTCELSYKIILKNWVGETTDENTMRIAFARSGNTFAPVNMVLLEK